MTLSPRRLQQLTLFLVVIGLAVRLHCLIVDPSIWFDEASLMMNVLEKSYSELLGPLDHAGNGPPFFIWLEKSLITWLGDSPLVWRLPATVASCLGLIVFYFVARRVLPPTGAVWAVGLFAFSDRILWHTAEVKPYTTDVFAAVVVLAAWLGTEGWQPIGRILVFSCLCPILVCLSYPTMFACIGPGLLMASDAWRSRRVRDLLAVGLFGLILAATCVWLIQGPIRAQHEGMKLAGWAWTHLMPDLTDPLKACWWPLSAAFEVPRYCFFPTGGFLCGFVLSGVYLVLRDRQFRLAVLLLAPCLAVVAAAYLHRYPCGCDRPILFLVPTLSLLIGYAIPTVFRWCSVGGNPGEKMPSSQWKHWCGRVARCVAAVLLLSPMVLSTYHVVVPWPRYDCRGAAEFVRSHRKPDDRIAITSWDQLYYYRDVDRRWWCHREWSNEREGTRYWVTINQVFSNRLPPQKLIAGKKGWKVVEQKEFDQLMVVLVERTDTGS